MFLLHYIDMSDFWNRHEEQKKLAQHIGKGLFGYVTGRRRIGKTELLAKVCREFGGLYHQAVEGTPEQQLLHLTDEIKGSLSIFSEVTPRSWDQFFKLLSRETLPPLIVFDEFPYWVSGDSTLPSLLQKWIDHELPKKKTTLIVSGSSQSMLYSQFLKPHAPLYGRASFKINLEPMSYSWFCKALKYPQKSPLSFQRYSLTGGVPYYWKLLPKGDLLQQVKTLYFDASALLAEEPKIILRDEGISGTLPKAILDLIGRGVSKPSELAARLNTPQGNLSRPLSLLLELGLIQKEHPYGESSRSTKKVLYSIQDSALSFYYGVTLPFRSRWDSMHSKEKQAILNQHAGQQWEIHCRKQFEDSGRYWEKGIEIDLIAYDPRTKKTIVGECKWKKISTREKKQLLIQLKQNFEKANLKRKPKEVQFEIFTPYESL